MSFAGIARLYEQPTALEGDPAVDRQRFVHGLDQEQRRLQQQRAPAEQAHRQEYDATLRALHSGAQGYGFLAPGAEQDRRWNPRYHPVGNPNQYMLDAILRDQALAGYDREAPALREAARALRTP